MTDSVPTNFTQDTTNKALEMLTSLETQATQPAPTETPTNLTATEIESPVAAPPASPVVPPPAALPLSADGALELPADAKIKIKVDGQDKIVTPSEYQEILSRTDVFHQRMQNIAKQRQELTEHFSQREAEILQAAQAVALAREELQRNNPLQQLLQIQQQQPPRNPNEIMTVGEVQEALQQFGARQQELAQAQQQQLNQQLQQQLTTAQRQAAINQDRMKLTAVIEGLFDSDEGKVLREIAPHAHQSLWFDTLQLMPDNLDQAVEYAKGLYAERVGKLKGHMTTKQTEQAVQAAKIVMEPPQGSAPPLQTAPAKVALNKDGSIDWNALRSRAMTYLDN